MASPCSADSPSGRATPSAAQPTAPRRRFARHQHGHQRHRGDRVHGGLLHRAGGPREQAGRQQQPGGVVAACDERQRHPPHRHRGGRELAVEDVALQVGRRAREGGGQPGGDPRAAAGERPRRGRGPEGDRSGGEHGGDPGGQRRRPLVEAHQQPEDQQESLGAVDEDLGVEPLAVSPARRDEPVPALVAHQRRADQRQPQDRGDGQQHQPERGHRPGHGPAATRPGAPALGCPLRVHDMERRRQDAGRGRPPGRPDRVRARSRPTPPARPDERARRARRGGLMSIPVPRPVRHRPRRRPA